MVLVGLLLHQLVMLSLFVADGFVGGALVCALSSIFVLLFFSFFFFSFYFSYSFIIRLYRIFIIKCMFLIRWHSHVVHARADHLHAAVVPKHTGQTQTRRAHRRARWADVCARRERPAGEWRARAAFVLSGKIIPPLGHLSVLGLCMHRPRSTRAASWLITHSLCSLLNRWPIPCRPTCSRSGRRCSASARI